MVTALPDPSPLAEQLYRTSHWWWGLRTAMALAAPALFAFSGLSARARAWAGRVGGGRWLPTFLLYLAAMLAFFFLLDLPVSYFGGYVREHAYGLSDQALSKWVSDELKGLAVVFAISAVAWAVPLRIVERSPHRWWAWTSAFALPGFFFVMWLTPVFIAPLFNEFHPVKDKALEAQVLELAHRAGIDADRVYEVNKSVDTRRMNAYVNGFLGSQRIVLFDTLIAKSEPREVLSVVGHEIGHFVLNHLIWGTLAAWLAASFGLYLIAKLLPIVLARHGTRVGAERLSDPAVLPVALLLAQLYATVINPAALAISRSMEHEADRFALEITRDNGAQMSVTAKFVEKDLAYPRPAPWVVWLRRSHPSPGDRFDFAKVYRPWEKGEPLKYEGYFRPAQGETSAPR